MGFDSAPMLKHWYSPADLADLALPGLPAERSRIAHMARDQRWGEQHNAAGEPLSRPRAGRGGGSEYHASLLPPSAVLELVKRGLLEPSYVSVTEVTETPSPERGEGTWGWFEAQTAKVKAEAQRRLMIVQAVDAAKLAGLKANAAVARAAAQHGVSAATIWNWLKLLAGVAVADRLPALAPRRKGGGVRVEVDDELFTIFKSDFLRPSGPSYSECYRRTLKIAKVRGITLPPVKTLQRRLEAEVPAEVIKLKRDGMDAVIQMIPAQRRTRANLHALEAVNIDGHKWDVFVRFPAKDGQPERIARPISVVIQDLYSNKILAWRTGQTESAILTRLAFADLFKNWGIPKRCTLDNGRAFASKWITGGAKSRFRFKIREDENWGLLTSFGIQIHWAKPHHGQAKPIERAFRDLEEAIGRHPACAGAYTGNHIDAKPEDYGNRAIDLADFEALVAEQIADHNAREGRRTENAKGRSFDGIFFESVQANPIGKASPEQMRLALLTADNVRANRKTGEVSIYGNAFHHQALYQVAGEMVTVRFDPDDLQSSVHVYKSTGEYICEAEVQAAVGFYDVAGAKARAKMEGDLRKATREAARLQGLISAADLAAMQPASQPVPEPAQPAVIRPVRPRRNGGAAVAALPAPVNEQTPVIDRFTSAVERLTPQERPRFSILDGGLADPHTEPEQPARK